MHNFIQNGDIMAKSDDIDLIKLVRNIGKFIDEVGKVMMKIYKWLKEKIDNNQTGKADSGWS